MFEFFLNLIITICLLSAATGAAMIAVHCLRETENREVTFPLGVVAAIMSMCTYGMAAHIAYNHLL